MASKVSQALNTARIPHHRCQGVGGGVQTPLPSPPPYPLPPKSSKGGVGGGSLDPPPPAVRRQECYLESQVIGNFIQEKSHLVNQAVPCWLPGSRPAGLSERVRDTYLASLSYAVSVSFARVAVVSLAAKAPATLAKVTAISSRLPSCFVVKASGSPRCCFCFLITAVSSAAASPSSSVGLFRMLPLFLRCLKPACTDGAGKADGTAPYSSAIAALISSTAVMM